MVDTDTTMRPVVYTHFLPCLLMNGPAKGDVRKMTAGKQAKTMPTASSDIPFVLASWGKNAGKMENNEWQSRLLKLISPIISSCTTMDGWMHRQINGGEL